MRFTVGVYTKQKLDGTYMVCASTWFTQKPEFSLSQATVKEMKKTLISLVCIEGKREASTINIAITRSIEQLFIRGLIANPLNDYPPIVIHAPATARVISSQYRFTPVRGCWLMNCSKRALEEIYESRISQAGRYASSRGCPNLRKVPKKVPAGRPGSSRAYLPEYRNGLK
jgi:hypothetical protein